MERHHREYTIYHRKHASSCVTVVGVVFFLYMWSLVFYAGFTLLHVFFVTYVIAPFCWICVQCTWSEMTRRKPLNKKIVYYQPIVEFYDSLTQVFANFRFVGRTSLYAIAVTGVLVCLNIITPPCHGYVFRVNSLLRVESIVHRWIP